MQSIVEASISDLSAALASGFVTSIELVTKYLQRIGTFDLNGPCLNSVVIFNRNVFDEAAASDARRAAGSSLGLLDGIPYTLKGSMKYKGLTCAAGSPAFEHLVADSDSFVAEQLRASGAVLLGLTNTPPMMASGMHRGLYGRAESPYNLDYLTAAFSSGSSNGAGSSTAASLAAFGLGSETVSSGRSPASNNGLVAYTPSRTVISPRGVWPLYPTCDVVVPMARSAEDMLHLLGPLTAVDKTRAGDFWREQTFVDVAPVKRPSSYLQLLDNAKESLRGKRIAVPAMYIDGHDSKAKPTTVSPHMLELWKQACIGLEQLGATVEVTDFPLVTNYEDDSVSGHANNVEGFRPDWNGKERGELVAYLWDDFLREFNDPGLPSLAEVDGEKMFPRPKDYIPDRWLETKNFMNYPRLVELAKQRHGKSIWEIYGIREALPALEAQRKRDLEDWMDRKGIDVVVFPSAGDVGRADLESDPETAAHALQNGVKYSNGNRAIRHMGVPTVSVTMGLMNGSRMPVNLTFAGKHGQDCLLLQYAYAFEQQSRRRVAPPLTPALKSDVIDLKQPDLPSHSQSKLELKDVEVEALNGRVKVRGMLSPAAAGSGKIVAHLKQPGFDLGSPAVELDGIDGQWSFETEFERIQPEKPLYGGYGEAFGKIFLILRAFSGAATTGKLIIV